MGTRTDFYERYRSTQVAGLEGGAAVDPQRALAYLRANFLSHLPAEKGARILDLGCGDGRYLAALNAAGYPNAIGVDVSAEQTDYAREVLRLPGIVRADFFEFLGSTEERFGAVLLIDVLEHLEAGASVDLLAAVRTRLARGGCVVVQVPNAMAPLSPWRYADLTHRRAYTTLSLLQSFSLAGFERDKVRFHEAVVPSRGAKAVGRALIWRTCLRPALVLFTSIAFGNTVGGLFSANLIAKAEA